MTTHQFIKETNFRQIKIPPITNFQLITKYQLCQNLLSYGVSTEHIAHGYIFSCINRIYRLSTQHMFIYFLLIDVTIIFVSNQDTRYNKLKENLPYIAIIYLICFVLYMSFQKLYMQCVLCNKISKSGLLVGFLESRAIISISYTIIISVRCVYTLWLRSWCIYLKISNL